MRWQWRACARARARAPSPRVGVYVCVCVLLPVCPIRDALPACVRAPPCCLLASRRVSSRLVSSLPLAAVSLLFSPLVSVSSLPSPPVLFTPLRKRSCCRLALSATAEGLTARQQQQLSCARASECIGPLRAEPSRGAAQSKCGANRIRACALLLLLHLLLCCTLCSHISAALRSLHCTVHRRFSETMHHINARVYLHDVFYNLQYTLVLEHSARAQRSTTRHACVCMCVCVAVESGQ